MANAPSKMSAKAITSADMTERVTMRDLWLLNAIGIAALLSSVSRMIRTSCDVRSWLFAYAASEHPTSRAILRSSLGNCTCAKLLCAYRTMSISLFRCAAASSSKQFSVLARAQIFRITYQGACLQAAQRAFALSGIH